MNDATYAGDKLLDAWLSLTSILWNSRLVKTLTYNEAHIMGILLRHADDETPLTATDLIRRTRLLKSQMNKLLTSLEERQFVVRSRAQMDKRLIHIRLTEEGKAAYLEAHEDIKQFLSVLIGRLGADHALSIAAELNEVCDILDELVPQP